MLICGWWLHIGILLLFPHPTLYHYLESGRGARLCAYNCHTWISPRKRATFHLHAAVLLEDRALARYAFRYQSYPLPVSKRFLVELPCELHLRKTDSFHRAEATFNPLRDSSHQHQQVGPYIPIFW